MKLLVTGGCGFIGSNFIRYWLNKYPHDKVLNLDKLTYAGHISSTKDFATNKNYSFKQGDICDMEVAQKCMQATDIVVHFAAESHVDRSIVGPAVFCQTNVLGTQILLSAAVEHKVKRFHYISTDEVFGDLPIESTKRFTENSRYNPHSPYSASKAASEHLVRAYWYTFGLPITITNCANNFGPYQNLESFVPRSIVNLIDGKEVVLYGDGKNVRDWLYVKDHCRAIDLVLKSGKVGETYLVGGSTRNVSNLDIANKIIKILGKADSAIKFVANRPGHDRMYAVDSTKIRRELDWRPIYDFDNYLKKTTEWYLKNEWWWRPFRTKADQLYKKTGQI